MNPQEGDSDKQCAEDQQELPGFNSKTHVSEVITKGPESTISDESKTIKDNGYNKDNDPIVPSDKQMVFVNEVIETDIIID